jgi:hypothetical protein
MVTENKSNRTDGMESIHLPAPTIWPLVLGLGITLSLAGLITNASITVLGLLLSALASVGWFRNVLPHEKHEEIFAKPDAGKWATARAQAPRAPRAPAHIKGGLLATYSFISGIEAGLAGGTAMAMIATVFSLLKFHSLWYGVNLMAAGTFLSWSDPSDAFLSAFHLSGLLVGMIVHGTISVLIGMLYAALMPIFPRLSLLTGGVFTPLMWTALSYSLMESVSPIMGARVNWIWFVVSQIAYGLVACLVVNMRVKVNSAAFRALPFEQRAGLHGNDAHSDAGKEVGP